MKCEEVRDLLPEYMEGSLKGRKLRALERHLRACEACQQELAGLREINALLSKNAPKYWESIDIRPEFLARLRQMDFEASRPQSGSILDALSGLWMRHRTGLVTAVSVCIVVIILVTVVPAFISPMGSPEQKESQPAITTQGEAASEQTPSATSAPQNEAEERAFSAKGAEPTETESVRGLEGPQEPEAPQGPSGEQGPQRPAYTTGEGLAVETRELIDSAEITNYTREEGKQAIDIALQNDEVKSLLAGKEVISVEVYRSTGDIEDWTGPVVIMTLSGAEDQQESQLSVYVDLGEDRVVDTEYLSDVQHR